jgi:phosphohistidine phosphatase
MTKHLILLRHAKAEESYLAKTDFERKLTKRGIEDANKMGHYFKNLNLMPDIIYCSDSMRTKQTIQEFKKASSIDVEVEFTHDLYHALGADFFKIFKECNKQNIMIVGHNMGISAVADWLSETNVEELPTCGLIVLEFENEIELEKGKVITYQVPKEL